MKDDRTISRFVLIQELRVEMMALHLGDDQIITEEEAATLLGVSPKTLYRMQVQVRCRVATLATSPAIRWGRYEP